MRRDCVYTGAMFTAKIATIAPTTSLTADDVAALIVAAMPKTLEVVSVDAYRYGEGVIADVVITGFASEREAHSITEYLRTAVTSTPLDVTVWTVWPVRFRL